MYQKSILLVIRWRKGLGGFLVTDASKTIVWCVSLVVGISTLVDNVEVSDDRLDQSYVHLVDQVDSLVLDCANCRNLGVGVTLEGVISHLLLGVDFLLEGSLDLVFW